jgi:DNA-binding GntR family transcriptional regulator
MMTLKYQSKNQLVYETIRDAIIRGEYAPGERIVIDDLAAKLGVSHSPIRECLRQLESDGYVIIRPYAGVTVTELQPSLISEVFAILEAMEVISSCRACVVMSDDQFDNLDALVAEMAEYTHRSEEWSRKNMELHLLICDMADTWLTREIMHNALHQWNRLRYHYLNNVSVLRIPQAHEEHLAIVKAMRQRDEAEVERVVRKHNRAALADYLRHIEQSEAVEESS